MIVRPSAGLIGIEAPAKLNLFFEILHKRPDGYHEVETLMVPINIFDTVYFARNPNGPVRLSCRLSSWAWHDRRIRQPHLLDVDVANVPDSVANTAVSAEFAGLFGRGSTFGNADFNKRQDVASRGFPPSDSHESLPDNGSNLVVQAVELLRVRAGVRDGARLHLVKRIPIAAGLGGGSSDAAAALVAANLGWNLGWSTDDLAVLAAELGSDVPFFLYRSAAICRGRGERIETLDPKRGFPNGTLDLVLIRPPAGLSTAEVYRASSPVEKPHSVNSLLDALQRGDRAQIGRHLFNRLQPVAKKLSDWIGKWEDVLAKEDCLGHLMSGSGTCYFGLCRHAQHARCVARRLGALGLGQAMAVRGQLGAVRKGGRATSSVA